MIPKNLNHLIYLMKLSIGQLLLIALFCNLTFATDLKAQADNVFDVELELNVQNQSILKVFEEIESLTAFRFAVNKQILRGKPNVTIDELFLGKVLASISDQARLNFRQVNDVIAVTEAKGKETSPVEVPIYDKSLQGKVIDSATGDPLIGATVRVKGTSIGAITEVDGTFSLSVPDDADTLIISYIGFLSQEAAIGNLISFNISLDPDITSLNEVVVVGYGTRRKENLTGSVGQVGVDELGVRPNASVVATIQGTLPGLNIQTNNGDPRENAEINVRGFNSINGGSALVLIDGIEGNINLLNPSDIESVTVLKDAGSAAIYGARGAFGVVLVTTKKGREGKARIEFSSVIGVTSPAARTDYITDPVLYGRTIDAAQGGFNGSTLTGYTNDEDWNRLQRVANGEVAPWRELQANGTFKYYYNTDWYDYLFDERVFSNIYNLSVSGGSEKLKTYLSGRYFTTETINNIQDEDVKRYNLKSNIVFQANDWLEISNDIQYNGGDQNEFGGRARGWGQPWTHANNSLFAFQPTEIDGIPFDFVGQSTHASVEAGQTFREYEYDQFVNQIAAKAAPLEGLEINANYSFRFTDESFQQRLNRFDYLTGPSAELNTVGINRFTETEVESWYQAFNFYTSYAKLISDKHNFRLLAGYNYEDFNEDNITAEVGELFDPNFSSLNLGTELLRTLGGNSQWALQGVFGRFNYDFDRKYLLEVNARYDGSSRFPSETRYGFFPSVSLGWAASRENFWEPLQTTFSNFKVRASIGELGNQNIPLNTFSQLLSRGLTGWLEQGTQLNEVSAPSPLPANITWERIVTSNLGFDLGFFKNKLNFSLDMFRKDIKDMYLPGEPLPAVFGANEPRENNADLEVNGFEVSVGYQNSFKVMDSPLNFKVSANISDFTGRITKFSNPNGVLSSFYEGQELGEIWGYRVDGQFQSDDEAAAYQASFENPSANLGQVYNFAVNIAQNSDWQGLRAGDLRYLDLDGDGEISAGENTLQDPGDLQVIGNSMPNLPFGFTIGADWKGFDVFVQGTGVVSQDWYPRGRLFWGTYERPYVAFIRKDLVSQAWSPENPNGRFPQIERGYTGLSSNRQLSALNDHFLTNIGYMRFKNITLGYTLPQKITERIGVDRFRVYVSGENLFTINFGGLTRYLDPEQAGSGISFSDPNATFTNIGRDRDRVEDYPLGRTFFLGVQITL